MPELNITQIEDFINTVLIYENRDRGKGRTTELLNIAKKLKGVLITATRNQADSFKSPDFQDVICFTDITRMLGENKPIILDNFTISEFFRIFKQDLSILRSHLRSKESELQFVKQMCTNFEQRYNDLSNELHENSICMGQQQIEIRRLLKILKENNIEVVSKWV